MGSLHCSVDPLVLYEVSLRAGKSGRKCDMHVSTYDANQLLYKPLTMPIHLKADRLQAWTIYNNYLQ